MWHLESARCILGLVVVLKGGAIVTLKQPREQGSERRETVQSLSVAGVGDFRGSARRTRGPEWTYRWCTSCLAKGIAG
ncbi:hypothetical protein STRINF_00007 [Streptococcus infantarius subsp. infantarius ATCC BAA-102]|uniref:Secreted protein n=1 Tax=Streptococcus infantarius subsp. infantarius ATCC BAA-102 TaxID=471872 RepID=A0ABP2DNS4_9STRE|nr:hypothetical protein STRINF_00007 [Streptococcus infantarius subsp. infantarius ATCC BAA-102]